MRSILITLLFSPAIYLSAAINEPDAYNPVFREWSTSLRNDNESVTHVDSLYTSSKEDSITIDWSLYSKSPAVFLYIKDSNEEEIAANISGQECGHSTIKIAANTQYRIYTTLFSDGPVDSVNIATVAVHRPNFISGTHGYGYLTEDAVSVEMNTQPEASEVSIPVYTVNGDNVYTVKRIGSFCNSAVRKITIPETIEEIGINAFFNCPNLTEVTIPASVKKIGIHAFDSTAKIIRMESKEPISIVGRPFADPDSIVVPADAFDKYYEAWAEYRDELVNETWKTKYEVLNLVASESENVMSSLVDSIGMSNLEHVYELKLSGTINSWEFFIMRQRMPHLEVLDISDCRIVASNKEYMQGLRTKNDVLPEKAFAGFQNLRRVYLPTSINTIEEKAFYQCARLDSIDIPDQITTIEDKAFAECRRLLYAHLPEQLTEISQSLFSGCDTLQNISIPASVTRILGGAFSGCKQLDSLYIAPCSNELLIGNSFDQSNKIRSFYYGRNLTGVSPVIACDSLRYVEVSNHVTELMNNAFSNCQKLDSISLPYTIAKIGSNAFSGCVLLRKVVMPDSIVLNKIENGAFKGCSNLNVIKLTEKVQDLGSEAFSGCLVADTISIPANVKTMGSKVFNGCTNVKWLIIDDGGSQLDAVSATFSGLSFDSLKIGRSITASSIFAGHTELKHVKFSSSFTDMYIPTLAFSGCSGLKELVIPGSIDSIGDQAFKNCNNIKTVQVNHINPIPIGQNTFSDSTYYYARLLVLPGRDYHYWIHTQWGQFRNIYEFDSNVDNLVVSNDVLFDERSVRVSGKPYIRILNHGGLTFEGSAVQESKGVILWMSDDENRGSLITSDNLNAPYLTINMIVPGREWQYFTVPCNLPLSSLGHSETTQIAIRIYDGASRAQSGSGWKPFTGDELKAGQGYVIQCSKKDTLVMHYELPVADPLTIFAGSEQQLPLQAFEGEMSDANWNYLGNPYTSYYQIQHILGGNTSPITVWNAGASRYDAYSVIDDKTFCLAPLQGFFVQKMSETASALILDPVGRTTYHKVRNMEALANEAPYYRAPMTEPAVSRQLYNLVMSGEESSDRTRIVINPSATLGYDLACDASKFMSTTAGIQLFSHYHGGSYAINERPQAAGEIQLGYAVKEAGNYTLHLNEEVDAVVYDALTNEYCNLQEADYQFTSEAGTFNDRFVLQVGSTNSIETVDMSGEQNDTIRYYYLSGAAVTDTAPVSEGTYIRVQGGKSTLIMVK